VKSDLVAVGIGHDTVDPHEWLVATKLSAGAFDGAALPGRVQVSRCNQS
jgi:hypothetical protein